MEFGDLALGRVPYGAELFLGWVHRLNSVGALLSCHEWVHGLNSVGALSSCHKWVYRLNSVGSLLVVGLVVGFIRIEL